MILNILVPILIIVAAVGLLGGIIIFISFRKKKEIIEKIKVFGEYLDNVLTINEKQYYIKIVKVGLNDDFSINSMSVMQIRSNTSSKLIRMVKTDLPKIIIVYPFNGKIKRYINENEMEFIKYCDFFWGMYVCKLNELELLVKHLGDINENI